MSQKDITEKTLFAYNDVFADVVNALLFNGEQVIAEKELVDQTPRAAYKADGVIRDIERCCKTFEDVLKKQNEPEGGVHTMCEVLDRVEAIGEIKGAIRIYREEMNLSPSEIVKKVVSKFALDEAEAWEYVKAAMGVQQQ